LFSVKNNNNNFAAPQNETEAKEAAARFQQKVEDLQIIDEVKKYEDWKPKVMEQ
jgi:hypothetical protein